MSEENKPVEKLEEKPIEEQKVETSAVEDKAEEASVIASVEVKEETPAPVEVKEEIPIKEPRIEGVVNKGDFIQIELTGRVAETGEIFDTTSEDIAKEKGINSENRTYGARLVVVGEGWVLRGLDAKLHGIKPNEQIAIEIMASDAFGERDSSNVQMIPFRILRSKGINPVIGAELEIEGRQAVVRSIGAGRVQVDYNHPLAGRKIIYDVKVDEIIEDEKAKVKALINRRFVGVDAEKFGQNWTKKKMTITIPDEVFFGENIQIAKRGVAMDVLKYFPDLEEVEFQEIVKRS
jgi:peptidylprolyl isomerase